LFFVFIIIIEKQNKVLYTDNEHMLK